MSSLIHLVIDAMGGDHGVKIVVPVAMQALKKDSNLRITLIGNKQLINAQLKGQISKQLVVIHTDEVIDIDDSPSIAIRKKKKSSMRLAIEMIKAGQADACISAGNTGALMAVSRHILGMIPGLSRPAIISPIPSNTALGAVYMLDLGANINCQSEQLCQFALMGSIYAQSVAGLISPKIGLLNVGAEEIKGTDEIKEANRLIQQAMSEQYKGYVEGHDIYLGSVDVVVTDGFVGNVALKTSEGLADFIFKQMRSTAKKNIWFRLTAWLAKPWLRSTFMRFDPKVHNGGSFLGLNGIVIKSHGRACPQAFLRAIWAAKKAVENQVTEKIKVNIQNRLEDY